MRLGPYAVLHAVADSVVDHHVRCPISWTPTSRPSFPFLGVMGPIFLGCGKNSPHSFAAERFASVLDYQQCDAGHCVAVYTLSSKTSGHPGRRANDKMAGTCLDSTETTPIDDILQANTIIAAVCRLAESARRKPVCPA